MRSIQKIKVLFWLAVLFQLMMSASVLLMPFASKVGQSNQTVIVLVGLLFWISAITGYVLVISANIARRRFIVRKTNDDLKMNCRSGITTFFANVPATIADVAMILSFLLFIVISFTVWRYDYISYILLFLFIFSLHMHCLFNGRIYKVTKFKRIKRGIQYE